MLMVKTILLKQGQQIPSFLTRGLYPFRLHHVIETVIYLLIGCKDIESERGLTQRLKSQKRLASLKICLLGRVVIGELPLPAL